MPVVFDAATEGIRSSGDPFQFTHTPAGTPRGVLVTIARNNSDANPVVGITYGGVAMTEVRTEGYPGSPSEPCFAGIWFLGSALPTGAQTVSADVVADPAAQFVALTVTADTDTEIVDQDGTQGLGANPSVTLQYDGRTCMAVAVFSSGLNDGSSVSPGSGCTAVHNHDFGNQTAFTERQTAPGTSDFTIGYTSGSDEYSFAAASVSEVDASQTPPYANVTIR